MQSIYPSKSWYFYHHQFASTHAVEICSTTLKKLSIRVSHKIGRWKINKNQNSSHIYYELLCTKDIWFVNKIPKHLYKNDDGDAFFFLCWKDDGDALINLYVSMLYYSLICMIHVKEEMITDTHLYFFVFINRQNNKVIINLHTQNINVVIRTPVLTSNVTILKFFPIELYFYGNSSSN